MKTYIQIDIAGVFPQVGVRIVTHHGQVKWDGGTVADRDTAIELALAAGTQRGLTIVCKGCGFTPFPGIPNCNKCPSYTYWNVPATAKKPNLDAVVSQCVKVLRGLEPTEHEAALHKICAQLSITL